MILIAYLTLLAGIGWALLPRHDVGTNSEERLTERVVGSCTGAGFIAVAALQLSLHTATGLGAGLLAALLFGATIYTAGALLWSSEGALWLRRFGWAVMLVVLIVPTTLSLGLPILVALAVMTLRARTSTTARREFD